MRRISAQYIFTSAGKPVKRGIVTTDDDGVILSVEDPGKEFTESAGTEFYNGIIIPGLINCHSHLELSHMRGVISGGKGLRDFIFSVRDQREAPHEEIVSKAAAADCEMYSGGVVGCGDISNNSSSFNIKGVSNIRYMTFIEVFGSDPLMAEEKMSKALLVKTEAKEAGLPCQITPHALYSMSEPLFKMTTGYISTRSVISLHFLESDYEREMTTAHIEKALALSRISSHLILVHNTVITETEAQKLADAGNTWFCLCPSSNMQITGLMPPVALLRKITDRIVAGTDSLASNNRLDMLTELGLLHEAIPEAPLDEIIRWGTVNGAKALCMSDTLGTIEPGKRPGLLLIEPIDLVNLRLLPESHIRRLL